MSNMIEPPIDDLRNKMGNNPYRLCAVVAKTAKEKEKRLGAELERSDKKSITLAAEDVYEGRVEASDLSSSSK